MSDENDMGAFIRALLDKQTDALRSLTFEREQRTDARLEALAKGTDEKINHLSETIGQLAESTVAGITRLAESTDAKINKLAEKIDNLADSLGTMRERVVALDEHRRMSRELAELRARVDELERGAHT